MKKIGICAAVTASVFAASAAANPAYQPGETLGYEYSKTVENHGNSGDIRDDISELESAVAKGDTEQADFGGDVDLFDLSYNARLEAQTHKVLSPISFGYDNSALGKGTASVSFSKTRQNMTLFSGLGFASGTVNSAPFLEAATLHKRLDTEKVTFGVTNAPVVLSEDSTLHIGADLSVMRDSAGLGGFEWSADADLGDVSTVDVAAGRSADNADASWNYSLDYGIAYKRDGLTFGAEIKNLMASDVDFGSFSMNANEGQVGAHGDVGYSSESEPSPQLRVNMSTQLTDAVSLHFASDAHLKEDRMGNLRRDTDLVLVNDAPYFSYLDQTRYGVSRHTAQMGKLSFDEGGVAADGVYQTFVEERTYLSFGADAGPLTADLAVTPETEDGERRGVSFRVGAETAF